MRSITFIIFLFLVVQTKAQNAYLVYFTDKNGTSFNPYEYFDQKAIERRLLQKIPLCDETDFPLNQTYIESVGLYADSMGTNSRWFNFTVAFVSDQNNLNKIGSLPFVKLVEKLQPVESGIASYGNDFKPGIDEGDFDLLRMQTERMGGKLFDSLGINGKGMRIAIFDAGFTSARSNPVFDQIRKEKRIIATKDFTRKKDGDVFYGSTHGTQVMTCIGGQYLGHKFGLATGAEFLLAKTEVNSEPFYEELNWLNAVEWADKNGADIINSSLAYTGRRYFTSQMDGKTSLVVKAANLAARKGMLVVDAAGNDGDNKWKAIATPADGDSVLTIGGIDPSKDYHIDFSSFGPTADKRMKPNVCAYGKVVTSTPSKITTSFGTSFATPLVAGFAACAWQANRSLTNMQLFREIEMSGHLFPYYDYAHGYGIPQAEHIVNQFPKPLKPTFLVIENDSQYIVKIDTAFLPQSVTMSKLDILSAVSKSLSALNNADSLTEVAKLLKNDSILSNSDSSEVVVPPKIKYSNTIPVERTDLIFYHIQGKDGVLKKYYVVQVEQADVLTLMKKDFEPGEKVRLFYRGFVSEIQF
jgi:hypothetical protein